MIRLKELRKEKGLTQQGLADELGVHFRTLQNWENGESQIKPDKAKILADYFGVSVAYLLGYDIPKVNLIQEVLELKQYRHLLIGGEVYIAESDVIQLIEQFFEEKSKW